MSSKKSKNTIDVVIEEVIEKPTKTIRKKKSTPDEPKSKNAIDVMMAEVSEKPKKIHRKKKSPSYEPTKKSGGFKKYIFPLEVEIEYNAERYFNCPPNSKSWIHGEQTDDKMDSGAGRRIEIIEEIKKIKVPEQRTLEWFKQREGMITASDGGTTLGVNHSEPQYNAVLKKLIKIPFTGNRFCHHGKKYEHIATMIYMYRMNVIVHEYGLVEHKIHKFIGASPDGIVDQFKFDGIHKTRLVGRMLEIKCPETRKINMTSTEILDICPIYYHAQVQLQLECCDLDECDFWQCDIGEYVNRQEFIEDTDPIEPYRSKSTGFEKGCLILLVPFGNQTKDMINTIYDDAKFIYPPKIEMTPYECDQWIAEKMSSFQKDTEFKNYTVFRTVYWKLNKARCLTIKRDRKWFADALPIFEKTWRYILFFRKNKRQYDILISYIKYIEQNYNKHDANHYVSQAMEIMFDINNKNYEKNIKSLVDKMNKPLELTEENDEWTVCG